KEDDVLGALPPASRTSVRSARTKKRPTRQLKIAVKLLNFSVLRASKPVTMEAILKRAAQRIHDSDEEKLLIEQAQGGDREAFEELIRRHDRDILRLAFHMLGNREEAREVFQETFLKAYRSLNRFRFQSSFYTWVYRIATNVSLDHLRKRQTLKEEISYESDTEMHPDRPALKDTLA